MSLVTDLQNIVEDVFATLSDFRTSVTYIAKSDSYAPGVGLVTANDTTYTVEAILTSYEQQDIDGISVFANDRKMLVPVNDLTPTPTLKDMITISSINWVIIGIKQDPALALWILQLRKP
jgi:hypothetical protein